jgi:hypothetical protein
LKNQSVTTQSTGTGPQPALPNRSENLATTNSHKNFDSYRSEHLKSSQPQIESLQLLVAKDDFSVDNGNSSARGDADEYFRNNTDKNFRPNLSNSDSKNKSALKYFILDETV